MANDIKNKLIETLKSGCDSDHCLMTTKKIANLAGVSYPTTLKYLEVLKAEGKVDYCSAGPSKVWSIVP
jgi:Mn-dependent DtxR family transcriptional regulator